MIAWLKDLLSGGAADAVAPTAAHSADPSVARQAGVPPSARARQGETLAKQLALVIDLNICVGCQACVTSCKQWNTSGAAGPLSDQDPYGASPSGTFFNRVQTYEAGSYPVTETVHFPKSCVHCEDPPCVPVCPPAPATSARPTASCWWTTTSASAASTALGPAPMARVNWTNTAR